MQGFMQLASFAVVAATLAASLLVPAPAGAREGISIGGGVKCYWVLDANGVYQKVCYRGV